MSPEENLQSLLDSLWVDPRPYDKMTEDTDHRVYGRLAHEDFMLLRYLHVKKGQSLTIAINIFLHRLILECKKRNITDLTNLNEFKQLVLGVRFDTLTGEPPTDRGSITKDKPMGLLTTGGRTALILDGQAVGPNVSGGTPCTGGSLESCKDDVTDVKDRAKRGHRRPPCRGEETGEKSTRGKRAKGVAGD